MSSLPTFETFRAVRHDRTWLGASYRLADAACIVFALFLVAALSPYPWWDSPWHRLYPLAGACAVGFFFLLAEYQSLYLGARGMSPWKEMRRVWWVWFATMLGLLLLSFSTKISADYPRRVILGWFVVAPLTLILWRSIFGWILRQVRSRFTVPERVAIVGAGDMAIRLAESIAAAPWVGMRVERIYESIANSARLAAQDAPGQMHQEWHELIESARQGRLDTIFVTISPAQGGRIQELIHDLADTPCAVFVVPDMFLSDLLHARWRSVNGIPVVNIFETPLEGIDDAFKRGFDVVVASCVLVILALPMLAIAIAIKLTSPGPVLFRQVRYGLDGREIIVWKFRSLYHTPRDTAFRQVQRNDARVTPLGRWLRRNSLDELPQFFNVLQGQMSIVGPRPHPVALNEQHRRQIRGYMLRHRVKPGITGLAQIHGYRGETDSIEKMQKRIEYDLAYIRNWSLGLDVSIIWKTLRKMARDDHAY